MGLFLSIFFHEFWHSVIARHFGLPMKGITLFIFGGVAEMEEEPPDAKAELLMALAGAISSCVLGGILLGVYRGGLAANWPQPVWGVLQYLGWLNIVLAVFNLIPAFPRDGGRGRAVRGHHYPQGHAEVPECEDRPGGKVVPPPGHRKCRRS